MPKQPVELDAAAAAAAVLRSRGVPYAVVRAIESNIAALIQSGLAQAERQALVQQDRVPAENTPTAATSATPAAATSATPTAATSATPTAATSATPTAHPLGLPNPKWPPSDLDPVLALAVLQVTLSKLDVNNDDFDRLHLMALHVVPLSVQRRLNQDTEFRQQVDILAEQTLQAEDDAWAILAPFLPEGSTQSLRGR